MSYRALRFARNDPTALASFDENLYVPNAKFGNRTLGDLVEELAGCRNRIRERAARLDGLCPPLLTFSA